MDDRLTDSRLARIAVEVDGVRLLDVRVTVHAVINAADHERRTSAGLGAVADPALLGRLLDLPPRARVCDATVWAEMSGQPSAVAYRGEDGLTVTCLLQPPLTIHQVAVSASTGHELAAVRDASLFAGFARRWIAVVAVSLDRVPEAVALEAALCGVGIMKGLGRGRPGGGPGLGRGMGGRG